MNVTTENETSIHIVKWQRLRDRLQKEMMQCHDCRMLRNALVILMDIMVPPGKEIDSADLPTPDPYTVTAHSEVLMKEPFSETPGPTHVEAKDGTKVVQEHVTKIL